MSFLDKDGLLYFFNKLKTYINSELSNVESVKDVQINGTSVLDSETGVAEISRATPTNYGVIKTNTTYGTATNVGGELYNVLASSGNIKAGTNKYQPIVSFNQHESTFYGLAKAAGHDEKNSTLPVGTYTPEAALAIRNMIGATGESASVTVVGTDPVIQASSNARYICGEVATLSFTPCASGICEVIFTSGTTPTVMAPLPETVQMPEWFVVEANHTYEISVIDGTYGSVMVW